MMKEPYEPLKITVYELEIEDVMLASGSTNTEETEETEETLPPLPMDPYEGIIP